MRFEDKETPSLTDAEPLGTEPRGFAPEQMVRCDACLRANPPTRTNCLYCAAQLPKTEASAALQRPQLRKPEKWEQGFNVILLPRDGARVSEEVLKEAARLLRLEREELERMVELSLPLPAARAASGEEASLIERKLKEMGVNATVISDTDLTLTNSGQRRAHAFELTDGELVAHSAASQEVWRAEWAKVALLVAGRLVTRRIELEERSSGRKAENEIVNERQLSTDEAVLDIYTAETDGGFRVSASSFDFSCLGAQKGLTTAQNFSTLTNVLRERASGAVYDDSYARVRRALEAAWPIEQHTEARGWRRERMGRVNTEAVITSDNDAQFTRYSRLRHYLTFHRTGL
ncbi:MAG: hypothetical protein M3362_08860 [Acidobacteriota bacterium]|nr:hypothetical protein [Acidobacteriota bacterium]